MKALPHATAIAPIHNGIMIGKLKGVMPPTTPKGSRTEKVSISPPTLGEISPFIRCGMPQANSMTSRPRWIDPRASARVLPCSWPISAASLSTFRTTSSRMANMTAARFGAGVVAQAGKAAAALRTAWSTSSADASGTREATSPVAGLNTSPNRPLVPGTRLPPMM